MSEKVDIKAIKWDLTIDVNTLKRIYCEMHVKSPAELLEVIQNPIDFANVLWAIIRPQAEKYRITQEDFDAACTGDFVDELVNGFMEAYANFFPSARRERVKKMQQIAQTQADLALLQADKALLEMQSEIQKMQQDLNPSGNTSTLPPVPPASTPVPSPGDS